MTCQSLESPAACGTSEACVQQYSCRIRTTQAIRTLCVPPARLNLGAPAPTQTKDSTWSCPSSSVSLSVITVVPQRWASDQLPNRFTHRVTVLGKLCAHPQPAPQHSSQPLGPGRTCCARGVPRPAAPSFVATPHHLLLPWCASAWPGPAAAPSCPWHQGSVQPGEEVGNMDMRSHTLSHIIFF
jgi:hypothetical protein